MGIFQKYSSIKFPFCVSLYSVSFISCSGGIITQRGNFLKFNTKNTGGYPLDVPNADCWSLILTSAELYSAFLHKMRSVNIKIPLGMDLLTANMIRRNEKNINLSCKVKLNDISFGFNSEDATQCRISNVLNNVDTKLFRSWKLKKMWAKHCLVNRKGE